MPNGYGTHECVICDLKRGGDFITENFQRCLYNPAKTHIILEVEVDLSKTPKEIAQSVENYLQSNLKIYQNIFQKKP